MRVSARCAAGLSGCAPCRLCRHAIQLQSFTPAPGDNPVVRCLAPLDVTEPVAPGRSNQPCVSASRSLRIRRNSLRQVEQKRAVLNAGGSCPSRHERQLTDNTHGLAIELPRRTSRPAPQGATWTFPPIVGRQTWPASVGEPEQLSCGDTEQATSPVGAVRPKASLSCRESWRWHGCASGFMAATVRRKQFPLRCHCVRRIPRAANCFRLPALHCVATASGAASPSPTGRITTRTRWARTLFNRKGRVEMQRLGPLPGQVSASLSPNRTCDFHRIRLSMRGCRHGWPSQFCEGVERTPELLAQYPDLAVDGFVPSVRYLYGSVGVVKRAAIMQEAKALHAITPPPPIAF